MKIYFEEFGAGHAVGYLTPGKLYDVLDDCGGKGVWMTIEDDEGVEATIRLANDNYTFSSWKVFPEETKAQSDVDIVASLESERNALANSIDSVNELLDSLAVPKAETLAERVKLAVNKQRDKNNGARIVNRSGRAVNVEMVTESGEVVLLDAISLGSVKC